MGCRQSQQLFKEHSHDNDNFQDNFHAMPDVDSRLPLDTRQVFKLKQSWKGIKRKIEETGVEMFIR